MVNLKLKCPHCEAPVEARYMPPCVAAVDHSNALAMPSTNEEMEIEPDCLLCRRPMDDDAMLVQARREYDRLIEGICSDK